MEQEKINQIRKEYLAMPLNKLAEEQNNLTCNILAHALSLTEESFGLVTGRDKKPRNTLDIRSTLMDSYNQKLEILEQVGEQRGRELITNYSN